MLLHRRFCEECANKINVFENLIVTQLVSTLLEFYRTHLHYHVRNYLYPVADELADHTLLKCYFIFSIFMSWSSKLSFP